MNIEVILRELLPTVCFGGVKLPRKNRLASNGRRFATRPLFWQDRRTPGNPRNFFYTHDGNKNVSEVISYSAANGLAAHYEYAPFGETLVAESCGPLASDEVAANNPWRFSSEYVDVDTATVYYNYRHYEPFECRWLSRDTVQSRNLYLLCENRILGNYDYLGLLAKVIECHACVRKMLRIRHGWRWNHMIKLSKTAIDATMNWIDQEGLMDIRKVIVFTMAVVCGAINASEIEIVTNRVFSANSAIAKSCVAHAFTKATVVSNEMIPQDELLLSRILAEIYIRKIALREYSKPTIQEDGLGNRYMIPHDRSHMFPTALPEDFEILGAPYKSLQLTMLPYVVSNKNLDGFMKGVLCEYRLGGAFQFALYVNLNTLSVYPDFYEDSPCHIIVQGLGRYPFLEERNVEKQTSFARNDRLHKLKR